MIRPTVKKFHRSYISDVENLKYRCLSESSSITQNILEQLLVQDTPHGFALVCLFYAEITLDDAVEIPTTNAWLALNLKNQEDFPDRMAIAHANAITILGVNGKPRSAM